MNRISSALVTWLLRLTTNRTLSSIITAVAAIMTALPEGALTECVEFVAQAAAKQNMDASSKFRWVYDQMSAAYPGIGRSTLNVLIETAVSAVKKGTTP